MYVLTSPALLPSYSPECRTPYVRLYHQQKHEKTQSTSHNRTESIQLKEIIVASTMGSRDRFLSLVLFIVLLQFSFVSSWSSSNRNGVSSSAAFSLFGQQRTGIPVPSSVTSSLVLSVSKEEQQQEEKEQQATTTGEFLLQVVAVSGLTESELNLVLEIIQSSYEAVVGLSIPCDTSQTVIKTLQYKDRDVVIPSGATGRVLILRTNLDDESKEALEYLVAEQMDPLVYNNYHGNSNDGKYLLSQPVLIAVENGSSTIMTTTNDENDIETILTNKIRQHLEEYEMIQPLTTHESSPSVLSDSALVPSLHVALDGAMTTATTKFHDNDRSEFWDTSSILVFDDLVSEELRRRLLEVVKMGKQGHEKGGEDGWDDCVQGPNPNRWIRNGLLDIPDDDDNDNKASEGTSCWGLPSEAIDELCNESFDAIQEMEVILAKLFPRFTVTRLPEAVFGDCVSPLTANAPTVGDVFQYHIDGDPNLTPPSPWTDVFGRYPNRQTGKPRFMSCLVYLNNEWDDEAWGAPTRCLDTPTNQEYNVRPKPGRCVLMDQDISHKVVAPHPDAGNRPRYSLVWKLILHPKHPDQDMMNLNLHLESDASGEEWPDPVLFGSAANEPSI